MKHFTSNLLHMVFGYITIIVHNKYQLNADAKKKIRSMAHGPRVYVGKNTDTDDTFMVYNTEGSHLFNVELKGMYKILR